MADHTEREALFRAEAERRGYPLPDGEADDQSGWVFVEGAQWADAHRPAPRTVTTVEALLDLFRDPDWFDVAVRDTHGRLWIVWETDHGDYFATSQRYEDDGILDSSLRPLTAIAFPATVLTPAPAPVDREALALRVCHARLGHMTPGTYPCELCRGEVDRVLAAIKGVSRG